MRDKLSRSFTAVAACAAFGTTLAPWAAFATNTRPPLRTAKPLVVHQVKPQLGKGHRLGPHHIFGMITAIDSTGNILTVKRRNGKMITVDATTSIANGDYSYPLFVGKTVAIDGTFGATQATFTAVHVDAITTLQSLEADE